jgi:hypothetical protein
MKSQIQIDPWIKLTAHEKLVLKVSKSVRCIFMELDKDGVLTFRAFFEKEPSTYERELISDALAETACDFPEIREHNLEYFSSSEPFQDLDKLSYWLFVRAEEVEQW